MGAPLSLYIMSNLSLRRFCFAGAIVACAVLSLRPCYGASATWDLNPGTDWNTATNWTPVTVPNGPSDTATFDVSNTTAVSISAPTQVDGILFTPAASAFTITIMPG